MSDESESERTQRTVAELLAQYGGASSPGTPHRRRRRSDSTTDTAPQTIIERVLSDSGRLLPVRDGEHGSRHGTARGPVQDRPPSRYQKPPHDSAQRGTGFHPRPEPGRPPADPADTRQASVAADESVTQVLPKVPAGTGQPGAGAARPGPEQPASSGAEPVPAAADGQGSSARIAPPRPAPDDTALDDTALEHTQVIARAAEQTQAHPAPFADEAPGVEPDAFAVPAGGDGKRPDIPLGDAADPGAGATSSGAGEDAGERSAAREWLLMAGQLAAGLLGGAVLWLAFEWLWRTLPAGALAAAVVVTVGLVWIVRRLRRAEDLQTTVLTVLVGLVVTVSPAALLLVSH